MSLQAHTIKEGRPGKRCRQSNEAGSLKRRPKKNIEASNPRRSAQAAHPGEGQWPTIEAANEASRSKQATERMDRGERIAANGSRQAISRRIVAALARGSRSGWVTEADSSRVRLDRRDHPPRSSTSIIHLDYPPRSSTSITHLDHPPRSSTSPQSFTSIIHLDHPPQSSTSIVHLDRSPRSPTSLAHHDHPPRSSTSIIHLDHPPQSSTSIIRLDHSLAFAAITCL